MKFIHLTDTHVIGGGRRLFGADPARRLTLAVESINRDHADAGQLDRVALGAKGIRLAVKLL